MKIGLLFCQKQLLQRRKSCASQICQRNKHTLVRQFNQNIKFEDQQAQLGVLFGLGYNRMYLFIFFTTVITLAVRVVLNILNNLDEQSHRNFAENFFVDPTTASKVGLSSVYQEASHELSVIVPAYNEQDRLGQTLDEMLHYLRQRRDRQGPNFTYEVIIVDDGSKDDTSKVAYQYSQKYGFDNVRVLKMLKNMGKGSAVRHGMLVSRGKLLLMADADGATQIRDVEALESKIKEIKKQASPQYLDSQKPAVPLATTMPSDLGMVCGSRAHLQNDAIAKRSAARNILMHGFHLLVTFVAGGNIKDTQCGFKLFTRQAAQWLFSNQRLQRWCFDVELVVLCQQLNIPTGEVSVHWTEMPGSKIKAISIVSMALELLAIKISYQILKVWNVKVGLQQRAS